MHENLYQENKRNKINSYQVKENFLICILALELMFKKPCFAKVVSLPGLEISTFKCTMHI